MVRESVAGGGLLPAPGPDAILGVSGSSRRSMRSWAAVRSEWARIAATRFRTGLPQILRNRMALEAPR